MKKIVLVFALIISTVTFAQNDAKAKSLLNEVSAKVISYKNISIDFKNVLENTSEDIRQETRGDVTIEGDKYRLNGLGITRIFDGSKLYTINPGDNEVTISSVYEEDEGTVTPSKMLTFYEEGFTCKMDIIQNVKGRKIQYVKLSPMDSNSSMKYILLGIDAETKHIYNLIEIGKNEIKTTLTVNSFKTNEPISKTLFTFDKSKYKKDYTIIKLD
ncbi:MAG: outer membrane lipoprotein carrier protein LolA [Lacinutrix sp.]|uniref:LolA family protein n=1 Tax=Lacinutrix sp. TaxID=1937692 RepID=UPI003095E76C